MQRILVIVNATAGAGTGARRRRALDTALERIGSRPGVEVRRTHSAVEGRASASAAALAGAAAVVAVGGDGTLSSVVAGLWEATQAGARSTALAVVPAGRGNDLANALLLARDPEAVLDALAGSPRFMPLDLGEVTADATTAVFVNGLGLGFDAAVAQGARQILLPGGAAYAVATGFVILHGGGLWRARGQIAGRPLDVALTGLSIGNGPTTGGGFRLTPEARPDDGELDYCLVNVAGRWSQMRALLKVLRAAHADHPGMVLGRLREFDLTFEPGVPIHADGEIVARSARRVGLRVLPAALRLLVPG